MMATLRRWLISGLLVTLPLVVTLWVLDLLVAFLDSSSRLLPQGWQPLVLFGFRVPGLGVVLTLCVVMLVGALASNYLGSKLIQWGNSLLGRIPVVSSIYSAAKQISDTLFSGKGNAFRNVVLVQYPRQGMWTIAFVTGKPLGEIAGHLNKVENEFISIFIPATPNPTSGFYLLVPRADTIPLKMSVDEAFKIVVSMGVIAAPTTSNDKIPHAPVKAVADTE